MYLEFVVATRRTYNKLHFFKDKEKHNFYKTCMDDNHKTLTYQD